MELTIGGEYLLGLNSYGGDELSASSCDLVRVWSDDIEADIEECDEDPCGGACVDPQVSSVY